jgi:hypothetical protein
MTKPTDPPKVKLGSPDGTLTPPAHPMRKTFAQLVGLPAGATLPEILAHLQQKQRPGG